MHDFILSFTSPPVLYFPSYKNLIYANLLIAPCLQAIQHLQSTPFKFFVSFCVSIVAFYKVGNGTIFKIEAQLYFL